MKIEMSPKLHPRRGGEVKVGNVYANPHGKNFYKIVVGIPTQAQRWNNVVCLHVDTSGNVVGASCSPKLYVSEHQDLVGFVNNMPSLKIEWLKEES